MRPDPARPAPMTTKSQPRLPGVGRGRARVGRTRRALDAYVAALRAAGRLDDFRVALLPVLRNLADDCDALAADPDHSAHTAALVNRSLSEQLHLFRPVDDTGPDPFSFLDDDDGADP